MEIFDTGGCEEYKQLRGVYISKAHGFLVVCSIVNKSSLDEADALVEEIIDVKGNVAPIMIVANKSDLDDDIKYPMQEGEYSFFLSYFMVLKDRISFY